MVNVGFSNGTVEPRNVLLQRYAHRKVSVNAEFYDGNPTKKIILRRKWWNCRCGELTGGDRTREATLDDPSKYGPAQQGTKARCDATRRDSGLIYLLLDYAWPFPRPKHICDAMQRDSSRTEL